MATVYLVVENPDAWSTLSLDAQPLSFDTYLADFPVKDEKKTRVINLCRTGRYLSKGYYCSLLAEARGHKVIPSVNTLTDLGNQELYLLQAGNLPAPGGKTPGAGRAGTSPQAEQDLHFKVYFGRSEQPELRSIAAKIFERFACPVLDVHLVWRGSWQIDSVRLVSVDDLDTTELAAFHSSLQSFTQGLWRSPRKRKSSRRWDLGILVNPAEKLPPSNAQALKRMQKAAGKLGLASEIIGPQDYARLPEFDALFIRETTEIDHHSYRFARKAQLEGLVVIDDPTSILRCCNKVFLQDAFTYQHVPTLKTRIVSGADEPDLEALEAEFDYPLVLKIPNSSFSLGVEKVAKRDELRERLSAFLKRSDLVIAQEYLYTDFDWRIGVLNHRPLYACRYYMARNHWQIYKHDGKRIGSGGFETLPTYEVPKLVLDAALKAAAVVGNGLYGIDLKQNGNRVYVIEVNDNPSLDHGVEDAFIGDELYMQLMGEFVRRLEERGR